MTNKLKVGVIGVGRMGSVHTRNLVQRVPQAEVVAVCDIRLDVAHSVAQECGIGIVLEDYRELLADDRIEAVVIASSTPTHAAMIQDAAAAGKPIFCEKPLALDLPSIDDALDAVARTGVKLQVGFNRRFDASFRRVRAVVASGGIGQPHILRITNRDPEPPSVAYLASSGGMFLDMTIHDFDMARYQVGEVEEVYAIANVLIDPEIGRVGDVDTDIVTLRFANGALGVIDNSRQATYGYDQRLEVFGSKGMAVAENASDNTVALSNGTGVHRARAPYFFMERYAEAYVTELCEFADAILKDELPPVTGEDGRLSVIMGYAAWKSYREHRPVRLDEITAT